MSKKFIALIVTVSLILTVVLIINWQNSRKNEPVGETTNGDNKLQSMREEKPASTELPRPPTKEEEAELLNSLPKD